MSGRIPKQFIDDLLARVDIVDIIDARVPLKKTGINYSACCPFHNEKTPSFTVSPTKQFFHCFGCGAHGTAIGFLMDYDNLEYPEAIEVLAQSQGIEVPREEGFNPSPDNQQNLYEILKQAEQYYRQQLKKHPSAIAYLKNRGLSGKTAADFGIGYVATGWDNILQHLGNSKTELAFKAGMLIKKDSGGFYDRFRERIMFPIRDRRGRCIGFGGRVLENGEPKYLNSPETPLFHKGRELYGLYEVRQYTNTPERILIVEGYMDVVMLAEHGIRNAVATLGTATTATHLQKLSKVSSELVFCFDGDHAGRQAAWRALETALPELDDKYQVRFLFLPDGEDPDSLVKHEGQAAFLERIKTAMPLSEYLFSQLTQRFDNTSLDGRAQLADAAKPLIKKVNAEILQQLLLSKLGELVGLPAEQLSNMQDQQTHFNTTSDKQLPKLKSQRLAMNNLRMAIATLITQPGLAKEPVDIESLKKLQNPGIPLLVELLALIKAEPTISTPALLERYRETPHATTLMKLASHEFPHADPKSFREEFIGAIQKLLAEAAEQRYLELLQKPRQELTPLELQELQAFRSH